MLTCLYVFAGNSNLTAGTGLSRKNRLLAVRNEVKLKGVHLLRIMIKTVIMTMLLLLVGMAYGQTPVEFQYDTDYAEGAWGSYVEITNANIWAVRFDPQGYEGQNFGEGTVLQVRARLHTGTGGNKAARFRIRADNNGRPGAVIRTSPEFNVTATYRPIWYAWTLPEPMEEWTEPFYIEVENRASGPGTSVFRQYIDDDGVQAPAGTQWGSTDSGSSWSEKNLDGDLMIRATMEIAFENDMAVVSIDNLPFYAEPGTNRSFQVTVENLGTEAQDNVPVILEIKDQDGTVVHYATVYTGTVNPGESVQLAFNWPVPGQNKASYEVTVRTDLPDDEWPMNDTIGPRGVNRESFAGMRFPPPGWQTYRSGDDDAGWFRSATRYQSPPGSAVHVGELAELDGWLIIPGFEVPADGRLAFREMSLHPGWSGYNGIWIRTDSYEDPPNGWTELERIEAGPDEVWREQEIDLALYEGQMVWLAFRYQSENPHFWYIDDVQVVFPPENDMAAISIDHLPFYVGPGTEQTFDATIENLGTFPQSNVPVIAEITDQDGTIVHNDTVRSGAVAPGETGQVTFHWDVPIQRNRYYGVMVRTHLAGDERPENDTIGPRWVNYEPFSEVRFPPPDWEEYRAGSGYIGWVRSTTRFKSSPGAAGHGRAGADPDGWLITPGFEVPSDGRLAFWDMSLYSGWSGYNGIWIRTGSYEPPNEEDWDELENVGAGFNEVWREQEIDLALYEGERVWLAFRYRGINAHTWYVDDVRLYDAREPNLILLDPNSGKQGADGLIITLSGEEFLEGMTVTFEPDEGITVHNQGDIYVERNSAVADISIAENTPSGSRSVTVTTLAGMSNSLPFTITATGIEEEKSASATRPFLQVEPNPLSGGMATLRYNLPQAGTALVTVFDVAGRSVFQQTTTGEQSSTVSLDLGCLSAGVYLLQLEAARFSAIRKLVVR